MVQKRDTKQVLLKILIWLFIVSASVSVSFSCVIGVYNLFGVLQTVEIQSTSEEKSDTYIEQKLSVNLKQKQNKENNYELLKINLEWLLLVVSICFIIYISYSNSLPKAWTPITLKVKLSN